MRNSFKHPTPTPQVELFPCVTKYESFGRTHWKSNYCTVHSHPYGYSGVVSGLLSIMAYYCILMVCTVCHVSEQVAHLLSVYSGSAIWGPARALLWTLMLHSVSTRSLLRWMFITTVSTQSIYQVGVLAVHCSEFLHVLFFSNPRHCTTACVDEVMNAHY